MCKESNCDLFEKSTIQIGKNKVEKKEDYFGNEIDMNQCIRNITVCFSHFIPTDALVFRTVLLVASK